jgi:phage repressor protein C with HTH and peptisase S24 domain
MARQAKTPRLLTHEQVWTALDRLAAQAGLSASGLARRAGLDPTTFNKSKRVTADGRERWPSTESIAKALAAADASIETFVQLTGDGARQAASVPLLAFAQAAERGHFDERGHLAGKGFDEIALPHAHRHARA